MTETKTTFLGRCMDSPKELRNSLRLLATLAAWAVVFLGCTYAVRHELVAGPLRWWVAALPIVAGLFVVYGYARFLRDADELQRLVQLQALALACGFTFVALASYPLFEHLGAAPMDAGDYTVVMAVSYSVGSVIGWRRYR